MPIDKCQGQVQELSSDQDTLSMGIDLALRIQPFQENHLERHRVRRTYWLLSSTGMRSSI